MASDNLNRVFIKAYGKGKPVVQEQSSTAGAAQQQDSWIVRIDTATVQSAVVPQMHNQRPPRHEIALAQPSQSPAPQASQQARSVAIPPTEWQPTAVEEIGSLGATQQAPSPSSFQGDFSQFFGGTTMIVPQASLGSSSNTHQPSSSQPSSNQPSPNQPSSNQPSPNQPSPNQLSSNRSSTAQSRGHQSTMSSEAPMLGPWNSANENSLTPTPPTTAKSEGISDLPEPRLVAPIELEQQIAAKNKRGEIFRLDRPSYATTPEPADVFVDDQDSSPSEASSMTAVKFIVDIDENQSAEAHSPHKGPGRSHSNRHHSTGSATSPVANEQVIAKERDLRRARVRIFNPLWEVDRLEWPRICVELLESIDSQTPGVANNLLNACQEGLQVLAVTSPQSGAGTSTVACCLAMIAGRHGLNVALVDGNMENPSLCYQTNLELEVDWHEAIARKLPLEEIAVHSVDDQITLVPLLARLSAPQLNEQNMAKMLTELSQSFDLVVVDLGHMSSARNMVTALGDLGALNAVVAVVDRRTSSAERIESCLRQIRQTGVASIGLVENFAA